MTQIVPGTPLSEALGNEKPGITGVAGPGSMQLCNDLSRCGILAAPQLSGAMEEAAAPLPPSRSPAVPPVPDQEGPGVSGGAIAAVPSLNPAG